MNPNKLNNVDIIIKQKGNDDITLRNVNIIIPNNDTLEKENDDIDVMLDFGNEDKKSLSKYIMPCIYTITSILLIILFMFYLFRWIEYGEDLIWVISYMLMSIVMSIACAYGWKEVFTNEEE